jgi:hypothetical protein
MIAATYAYTCTLYYYSQLEHGPVLFARVSIHAVYQATPPSFGFKKSYPSDPKFGIHVS